MNTIREQFETVIQELIQEAYSFTGPSRAVDVIWIYISNQGGTSFAQPIYSLGGKILRAHELDDALPTPVHSRDQSYDFIKSFARTAMQLIFAWEDSGEEEPTRIIARYAVNDQSLDSEFRYEPIPRGDDDTWGHVFQQWVARLAQTGDDSA